MSLIGTVSLPPDIVKEMRQRQQKTNSLPSPEIFDSFQKGEKSFKKKANQRLQLDQAAKQIFTINLSENKPVRITQRQH